MFYVVYFMHIISIDPGYERLGIAVLEKNNGKEKLIYSECFKTPSKIPHCDRLEMIGRKIKEIVKKFKPEAAAIEKLFLNINQKTAMAVSEARGAILYELASNGLLVREFTPLEIKSAVTGYGRSDKRQIVYMVGKLLDINKKIKYDDEFDAIAVGLTFFAYQKNDSIKGNN